jgi:5'-nucleotidase
MKHINQTQTTQTSNEQKPIVLVDMDGVIARFNEHLVEYAHTKLGAPLLSADDFTTFHANEAYPDEWKDRVEFLSEDEGFFASLPLIDGAVTALKEMEEAGICVFICTSPKKYYSNPHCAGEKHGWIMRHFGKKWTEKIILTRDKTLVHGDVLIDDKPEVTGAMVPSWKHVYFDQPYNRENLARKRITSWKHWREVILPFLNRE